MITKKEESKMYEDTYPFAFGKDRAFFIENDYAAICDFLRENFCGEGLYYKAKLLATLLHNDGRLQPKKIRKNFLAKSEELTKYVNQLPI
jgi:hypothetical protein